MNEIDQAELSEALKVKAGDVDAALRAVSPVGSSIGLNELSAMFAVDPAKDQATFAARAILYLRATNLIEQFTGILRGRRGAGLSTAEAANMAISPIAGAQFFTRTVFARCGIYRSGDFKGSGCLVGPSLVLTCAHVLDPANEDDEFDDVEVLLETHVRVGAWPKPLAMALPSLADSIDPLSEVDDEYGDADDFALLRMRLPSGGDAAIVHMPPDPPWTPTRDASVYILHNPQGEDRGVGTAFLGSFAKPSARWRYRAPTDGGSSGGGCFNTQGQLIGIHQGRIANGKRLVPVNRFLVRIRDHVRADLAPDYLWSLNGQLSGALVLGRDELFLCFNAMAEPASRLRALRIRRIDPSGPVDGLGYSVEIIKQLIDRRPDGHRALVVAWPQAIHDDFDIISQLAQLAKADGITDSAIIAFDGAKAGETGDATFAAARADQLVRTLHAAAEAAEETLWIIIEHSVAQLGRQVVPLETLATLIARWPRLRLVLVGNETVRLPDPEFPITELERRAPEGILVDFIRPFTRADVERLVRHVHQDFLGSPPTAPQLKAWVNRALHGIEPIGNAFPIGNASIVVERLREALAMLEPVA